MTAPKIPENEAERLKELASYSILDTLPEADYDYLTAIASEICGTSVSLISLIDKDRQWFKSHHGLHASEFSRESAFCAHAINDPDRVFIVQDARIDKRFSDNPLVTGHPHVIFYAGVPLKSHQGLPLGTLCVIDKTPKQLSQSQIDSLKALSQQVMNLLELRRNKAQLEKTLRHLKQKNHELEQFALVAAHDIRSPLSNISSLAEILLSDYHPQLDKHGKQMLEMISSCSSKLKGLVEGLLEYSRSDRVLEEEKSMLKIDALINDLKDLFVIDHTCCLTLRSDLKQILVTKTAFHQIMINLIANAIKYNDKKLTYIEIGIADGLDKYEFYVQDNGPGIAPEFHQQVFELFKVISASDKFGDSGNGVGLATVKKMVEAQGGSIYIDSDLGKGVRFTFTLEK